MKSTGKSILKENTNNMAGQRFNRKATRAPVERYIPGLFLERKFIIMESTEKTQTNSIKDDEGQVSTQAEPKDKETAAEKIYEIAKELRPSFQESLLRELEQRKEDLAQESPAFKAGYDLGLKLQQIAGEKIDAMSNEEIVSRIGEILKDMSPSYNESLLRVIEKRHKGEQLSIDQQTQERIKAYYKNLDPKTKLAICTLSELECLDGINFQHLQKEGKLIDEIGNDLQNSCLETYHTEPDDVIDVAIGTIDKEDIWLAGVWESTRMILQNC